MLYTLFPMVECNVVNKSVKQEQNTTWNKITKEESIEEIEIFTGIQEDDAKNLLKGIHEKISSLQDKAKVTAVAVTLAFSMVGGISSYILNLKDKLYANVWITAILVFFVIASCFYLIVSGYYSLLTLNSRPKYDFSPKDYAYLSNLSTDEEKKKEKLLMIGTQYKMTTFQNIILNNYVDCSNNNLRNALISLGVFFSLICLSFTITTNYSNQLEQQSNILTEQTELIKNLQEEINILQEESKNIQKNLSDLDKSSKDVNAEINSEIQKLNLLLEISLSDDKNKN
ncbi:hypothetical protein ABER60_12000 [Heyndrickxia coagulans]|uniref:hypothetical protein n=1 Tax=Heyndrickxia coagulans TaxID=1398 RepID=UPI003D256009